MIDRITEQPFCQTRVISWLDCLAQMPNRSTKEKIKIKKAWENMFSYYGSKSKIVDYYPPPKHKRIIEPFAGSARYSLKYWQNDVLLVDKYHIIVRTWKWLQQCSEKDIRKLPIMKLGETLDNYNLTEDEKIFMGFIVQQGTTGLRKTVSSYAVDRIATQLNNVATQLHKIKHWEIKQASFD